MTIKQSNPTYIPISSEHRTCSHFHHCLHQKVPQFTAVCCCSNYKAVSCIFYLFLSNKFHYLYSFVWNSNTFWFEFNLPFQLYFPLFFISPLLDPNKSTHLKRHTHSSPATFGNAIIPPTLVLLAESFLFPRTNSRPSSCMSRHQPHQDA